MRLGPSSASAHVKDGNVLRRPMISASEKNDVSPPLWLIRPVEEVEREPGEGAEHEPLPVPKYHGPARFDPVLQAVQQPTMDLINPGFNFAGLGNAFPGFSVSVAPPDTNGDVGPNHYVQTVNLSYVVFNKAGVRVFGPFTTNNIWSGFGGPCQTQNDGDPVVLYDPMADRWFVTQFALPNFPSGPSYQCIAVSTTPDPTGQYYRYVFSYPEGIPDYGKFGAWPDGYYGTYNLFTYSGGWAFSGGETCVFERGKMLDGLPATQQCFNLGTAFGGLLPADLDGPRLPPAGAPNLITTFDNTPPPAGNGDVIQNWKFHVDWNTPANTLLSRLPDIPVASISLPCGNGGACVPQSGSTTSLDTLGDRLMFRAAYRNRGTAESLLLNHTVAAGGLTGIRWYELRNVSTTPVKAQEGTYAPADGKYRWMGSMAMDQDGNIGLGLSVSSSSMFPLIAYTGHGSGDAPGTMPQGETTLFAGTGSQLGTSGRWGDYSDMTVDPNDECTFWFTTEHYNTTASYNWATRVGSFRFANCPVLQANDFSINVTGARSQQVVVGNTVTYTITTAVAAGTAQPIALSATGLPTGVTASFSPSTVTAGSTATLTLSAAPGSQAPSTPFQIIGTAASGVHVAVASVSVVINDFSFAVTPSTRTLVGGGTVTYTVNASVLTGNPESIALAVTGLPAGVTAAWSANPFTPPGTSTLTLTASPTVFSGTFTLTISGTAASATHSATVQLITQGNDFSLTLTPSARSIRSGQTASYTVATARVAGNVETIQLSFDPATVPAGVTASISPSSVMTGGSATLTLTASPTAFGVTAAVVVSGVAPSASHTQTATLTILNDFSMTLTPSSRNISSGGTTTYTIDTAPTSGSPENITFVTSGLPVGVTGTFSPSTIVAGQSTTLTLAADSATSGGTTTFTVRGTSLSVNQTATASVTVVNDFGITVSPSSKTMASGSTTTFNVDVPRTSGSPELVALTVSGLPPGVTGAFTPATLNAGGRAVLTLTAAAGAPGGTATFTVTGRAPSATHTATADVTVSNDFSIALSPPRQNVSSGSSTPITVNTSVTSGTAEQVTLAISGLPAGLTGAFSPATVTAGEPSTLTITADSSMAGGTSSYTVTGTAPSGSHTASGQVTVVNDFSLAVTPPTATVTAGSVATFTVDTAKTSGTAETISLSISGLPAGMTGSFSPATVTAGGSSTLTVVVPSGALGTITFTVNGRAPSVTHTATGTLVIANDFGIALSPVSRTITSGGSITFSVVTTRTSGSAETIALTATGLPAGVTASFSPATVVAGGGSTLTLTADASAPGANGSFQVIGTASSSTHGATGTLIVKSDFSIAVNPASGSITGGSTTTFTIVTARTSGSPEMVALSLSGLPTGVTGNFNPASVTAGDSSTLALNAASNAVGTTTFSVTGTASSASHIARGVLRVQNDFSFNVSAASAFLTAGGTRTLAISTTVTSGVAEVIALSVTGLPAGVTASFASPSITAGDNVDLTLTAGGPITAGAIGSVTVTGTATSATHTASTSVTTLAQPTVTITAPAGGSKVKGTATVNATATVSEGTTLASLELYADDVLFGTFTTSTATAMWNTTALSNGSHTLRAKVTDAAGNSVSSTPARVEVRNFANPVVSLTAPAEGAKVQKDVTLTATATASAGTTIAKVEFFVDDVSVGSSTSASASLTWDSTSVSNGSHTLVAKGTDADDNIGSSTAVTLEVENARGCGCSTGSDGAQFAGLLALLLLARSRKWTLRPRA